MLNINYVAEQGRRFFPITSRKAIVGLATNTLVLSEAVDIDIDINVDGEPITINPVVKSELDKLNGRVTALDTKTTAAINAIKETLKTKANSDTAGVANSAHKLQTARSIALTGAVTGSVTFDGTRNVSITTAVAHTHNYAGSSSAGGVANSALKLQTGRSITLTGAVTGATTFDGTGNVSINTGINHTHSYAGSSSSGGAANTALRLTTARNIALAGVIRGSVNFDGSGNVSITTTFGNSANYLPLTGGTVTGSFTANGNIQAHGRYHQGNNIGSLTAIQSSGPTGTMLWAW